MSENKCQFDIGEKVWIIPFDDLYDQYGSGDNTMYGITKARWDDVQSRSPHETTNIDEGEYAYRLKNEPMWWPSWALFPDSPAINAPIEDLL